MQDGESIMAMNRHVMGVDLGSTTAKAVILDQHSRIVAREVVQMGAVSGDAMTDAIRRALASAGLSEAQIANTVATGYGRRMIDSASKSYTEITCHARGAAHMVPGVRLVIDIGGQDSKVIAVAPDGLVETFAMNDRCAGGTGKFLETLARSLEVPLEDMGAMALQAQGELAISSICATFAETEVISLLAEGSSKPDVAAAVHGSVARRTLGLVSRVGLRKPIAMTGGVARNAAAVRAIVRELGTEITVPPDPQIAGALGAALFALDALRVAKQESEQAEEDRLSAVAIPGSDAPKCRLGSGGDDPSATIAPRPTGPLARFLGQLSPSGREWRKR